ncbi:twin-arginine translocation signal domain-containing protein [Rhizobium puerariae]|uniref:Twin-arginine translocation signal domain-containing protein n=1 Tax=Rhizobium puerariae TaxID=1585791 RepID=A0ABV6AS94_9HYPH
MANDANTTRRNVLKLIPAAATAAAVPAVAMAAPPQPMNPADAMQFHARELFQAAGTLGHSQFIFVMPRYNGEVWMSVGYYRDGEDPNAEGTRSSNYLIKVEGVSA